MEKPGDDLLVPGEGIRFLRRFFRGVDMLAGEYGQDLPRTLDSISAANPSPDSL
jgi:hypothetical protein